MKQLETGSYDVVNHAGRFHPLGSKREKLAGEKFSMKAVARLVEIMGETLSWHKFNLHIHGKHEENEAE